MKCCELTAASLRETVTVQRKQAAPDGLGGQTITWATLSTPRAKVKPLSGREALQAMQLQASITHRVYVRYGVDVTPADRLLLRGEPLQVRAVINMEMADRWLELTCDAGVAT